MTKYPNALTRHNHGRLQLLFITLLLLSLFCLLPSVARAADIFAINLESSLVPLTADVIPGFGEKQSYVNEFNKDEQGLYRLRLGFFTTLDEAQDALSALTKNYPSARVTVVSSSEVRQATNSESSEPATIADSNHIGSIFDHDSTGFTLAGAHLRISCDRCHVRGTFKGTPRQCITCHSSGGRISAPGRPLQHILTQEDCDKCHSSRNWSNVTVDHVAVTGTCVSCHNGSTAPGKTANHIATTSDCGSCHTTAAFPIWTWMVNRSWSSAGPGPN